MKWIYVTSAHHAHAQNVGLALCERQLLKIWHAGFVSTSQDFLKTSLPRRLLKILENRRMDDRIPHSLIDFFPYFELARIFSYRCKLGSSVEDYFWERGEFALDRRASRSLEQTCSGIMGFEHGCLFSLQVAKRMGLRSAVHFSSVHHSMRKQWMDPENQKHARWLLSGEDRLLKQGMVRDARRDEEMSVADQIFANSTLTGKSLIQGGVNPSKVVVIPLGLPSASIGLAKNSSRKLRVLYVGAVSLQKGFPYLQKAFQAFEEKWIQLDVFGQIRVRSKELLNSDNIIFHGAVSPERLRRAYQESDVLVFPSLCDGFGQVVGEALSHGVPVICSQNAGAVDFIQHGKNGFRIDPADSSAIQNALQQCLDDRDALTSMGEVARKTCEQWSWDDFRKTFINKLVQDSGRNV